MANDLHNPKKNPTLPNLQDCRAVALTALYAECLSKRPITCRYAIPFGFACLCGHPDRSAIVANTSEFLKQGGNEGS